VTFLEGLTDGPRIFRETSVSQFGLGRTRSQSTGPSVSVYNPKNGPGIGPDITISGI
jgi:hypothetical protein